MACRFGSTPNRSAETKAAHAALCAVLIALGGAAASQAADAANSARDQTKDLRVIFNGRLVGLRVLKADMNLSLEEATWRGEARFRSAGLVGFFAASTVNSDGSGPLTAGVPGPGRYDHVERQKKKERAISIARRAEPLPSVSVAVAPPFADLGSPPASEADKLAALDPLAALAAITLDGGDAPCARTIPVFDSRLRYDLEFSSLGRQDINVRGYAGPAHACSVRYRPIAGFDAEDMARPELYETPIHVWLADLPGGLTPPVRITARFQTGALSLPVAIEATIVSQSDTRSEP